MRIGQYENGLSDVFESNDIAKLRAKDIPQYQNNILSSKIKHFTKFALGKRARVGSVSSFKKQYKSLPDKV